MNIFEGARRIAKIGMVAILLSVGAAVWTHEPYVERFYQVTEPDQLSVVTSCAGLSEHRVPVEIEGAFVRAVICSNQEGHSVRLPDGEKTIISDIVAEKRMKNAFTVAGYTALCMAFYWLAIFSIGWVMRGFLGIPAGQDYKITPIRD